MKILCTGDWQCAVTNLDRCQRVVEQVVNFCDKDTYVLLEDHGN